MVQPHAPSPSTATGRRRPPNLTHADIEQIVIFHIGMTITAPWRPDLWLPVFTAMPRMLAELHRNRAEHERGEAEDLGFLGAHTLLGARGPWVVQYWKSIEQLYAYAHLTSAEHLPAWKTFNAAARKHPGAVGIWHETFVVPAGGIETFYGNGADLGLARAVGSAPLSRRGRTARERLRTGGVGDPASTGGSGTDPSGVPARRSGGSDGPRGTRSGQEPG